MKWAALLVSILTAALAGIKAGDTNYLLGAGRSDITGPAAEVNMMGYADVKQQTAGIHFRLYSRAFIVADGNRRFVFVSLDTQSGAQAVKREVIRRLRTQYSGLYTEKNVAISATHTHSGPGGFFQYLLYDITALGFVKHSFEAVVRGTVESIRMAHSRLRPGNIYLNKGTLLNANINRSPYSYQKNVDKDQYRYNVDKEMTVLKMVDSSNKPIGMVSWFPVHCTSMRSSNTLISGDNKGYASLLMEAEINGANTLPNEGKFVAAFAQSNEGDVSPNILGDFCSDTGRRCDVKTSTCNGKASLCHSRGLGRDMFESTEIIARRQFTKALELYNRASTKLKGSVDFRHTYVDMSKVRLTVDGKQVQTCSPALGYSFAAGTTDGPGADGFFQGNAGGGSPLFNFLRNLLSKPSDSQKNCHKPKPILLNTGEIRLPYAWQPKIVDTQLLQVGQVAIAAVPGEFSTMAGRRLRNAVKKTLQNGGMSKDTTVILAGLSNTYVNYITTKEEYEVQRYEGASTLYGPYTLDAFIKQYSTLATNLAKGSSAPAGPAPPNLLSRQITHFKPIIADGTPWFKRFGGVIKNANSRYKAGDTVTVRFWAGNPRNNPMVKTFCSVQRKTGGKWRTVRTDASLDTRFYWKRTNVVLGQSQVTVEWRTDRNVPSGYYRIRHYGFYKPLFSKPKPYSGTSRTFSVSK